MIELSEITDPEFLERIAKDEEEVFCRFKDDIGDERIREFLRVERGYSEKDIERFCRYFFSFDG